MPEATATAIIAPLIGQFIFWFITGLVALLFFIVGKLYWDNRQLRKGAIDAAFNGIQKAVEDLTDSMKSMAKEYTHSFAKGEKRFDGIERRMTIVETQCNERRKQNG